MSNLFASKIIIQSAGQMSRTKSPRSLVFIIMSIVFCSVCHTLALDNSSKTTNTTALTTTTASSENLEPLNLSQLQTEVPTTHTNDHDGSLYTRQQPSKNGDGNHDLRSEAQPATNVPSTSSSTAYPILMTTISLTDDGDGDGDYLHRDGLRADEKHSPSSRLSVASADDGNPMNVDSSEQSRRSSLFDSTLDPATLLNWLTMNNDTSKPIDGGTTEPLQVSETIRPKYRQANAYDTKDLLSRLTEPAPSEAQQRLAGLKSSEFQTEPLNKAQWQAPTTTISSRGQQQDDSLQGDFWSRTTNLLDLLYLIGRLNSIDENRSPMSDQERSQQARFKPLAVSHYSSQRAENSARGELAASESLKSARIPAGDLHLEDGGRNGGIDLVASRDAAPSIAGSSSSRPRPDRNSNKLAALKSKLLLVSPYTVNFETGSPVYNVNKFLLTPDHLSKVRSGVGQSADSTLGSASRRQTELQEKLIHYNKNGISIDELEKISRRGSSKQQVKIEVDFPANEGTTKATRVNYDYRPKVSGLSSNSAADRSTKRTPNAGNQPDSFEQIISSKFPTGTIIIGDQPTATKHVEPKNRRDNQAANKSLASGATATSSTDRVSPGSNKQEQNVVLLSAGQQPALAGDSKAARNQMAANGDYPDLSLSIDHGPSKKASVLYAMTGRYLAPDEIPRPLTIADIAGKHGVPFRLKSPIAGESHYRPVELPRSEVAPLESSHYGDYFYMTHKRPPPANNPLGPASIIDEELKRKLAEKAIEALGEDTELSASILNELYKLSSQRQRSPPAQVSATTAAAAAATGWPGIYPLASSSAAANYYQLPGPVQNLQNMIHFPATTLLEQANDTANDGPESAGYFQSSAPIESVLDSGSSEGPSTSAASPMNLMVPSLAYRWALSRMPDLIPIPLAATVPGYLIRLSNGQILAAALTNSFSIQGIHKGPLNAGYRSFLQQLRLRNTRLRSSPPRPSSIRHLVADSAIDPVAVPAPLLPLIASAGGAGATKGHSDKTAAGGLFARGVLSQLGFGRASQRAPNSPSSSSAAAATGARDDQPAKKATASNLLPFTDQELASMPLANLNDPVFSFEDEYEQSDIQASPPPTFSPMINHQRPPLNQIQSTDIKSKLLQLLNLKNLIGEDYFQESKRRRSPAAFIRRPTRWSFFLP